MQRFHASVALAETASVALCQVLIGWRVRVDGFGEGIVTAVRRRRLRSTLFSISGHLMLFDSSFSPP